MKHFKLYLTVLVLGTALIISSCSEDDNNPVTPGGSSGSGTFTLNGAGYSNSTLNITSGGALYDIVQQETGISLVGTVGGNTAHIVVTFPGSSTGSFNWSDTTSYVNFWTNVSTPFLSDTGTTNITSYGGVGSNISGNLSGKLALFGGDTLNISGNFSALRGTNIGKRK